jgi:hypothetical protein
MVAVMAHAPDNLDALTDPETHLVSFVLRFVCDGPADPDCGPAAGWHGVLRHVQTNTELHFTRWDEAVAFISRHVALAPAAQSPNHPIANHQSPSS